MIIGMIAIGVAVLALCAYVGAVQLRRQRTPPELRGRWWPEFERQFRAYAEEAARQRREARSRQRPTRRPPAP